MGDAVRFKQRGEREVRSEQRQTRHLLAEYGHRAALGALHAFHAAVCPKTQHEGAEREGRQRQQAFSEKDGGIYRGQRQTARSVRASALAHTTHKGGVYLRSLGRGAHIRAA